MRPILALLFMLALAIASVGVRAQGTHEPTVDEIYQAATHGDLPGARRMVDQVLAGHPNSAKAHYVKAEIAARQRDAAVARTELQIAERLAPGLPFAKAESVSALRKQIDGLAERSVPARQAPPVNAGTQRVNAPPVAPAGSGFPMGWLLLAGLVVVVGVVLLRSRSRAAAATPGSPPQRLDEGFGRYDANNPPPGYGGVPPGAYPQPQAPSMGSTLGRGLATGLAVGAGVVAAEEIGRRMFDHAGRPVEPGALHGGSAANSSLAQDAGLGALSGQPDPNADMGGRDFGLAADGGWDDAAGGGDFGVDAGGDDWNT
jgi:hypothetical protein